MKPGDFPVAGELRAASRLKRKTAGKTPSRFMGKAATAQFQNVWIWPGRGTPRRSYFSVVWPERAGGGLVPRVLRTLNLWRVLCKYPRGLVKTLWSGSYYLWSSSQPAHTASNFAGERVTLVLLRPLSSSHLEAKNENGREKLPAVCWGSAVTALSRDVWIWPSQSPDKATLVRPYSPSSRKTRSRSLPACRCSFRNRCQSLTQRNTFPPG